MKIKQIAFFLLVSTLLALTGYSEPLPYKETQLGDYLYLNPFSNKPDTEQAHWEYADSLREAGKYKAAQKQFDIFLKRWPNSPLAPAALQAVGDLYFSQGKDKKAFESYERLIQTYYTGLKDYESILEKQVEIALREMERKRMRFLFGGYSAPERAIPYLESILKNAPQWDRAPELQFEIGEAYRKDGNEEMAVEAYTVVEYRYPDSDFAERAAWAKIQCLKELVRVTPYSVDIREQAQLAVQLFADTYPESEHLSEADRFDDVLRDAAAKHAYEVGEFYERVPRPARAEAATIYYEKVATEYPETSYAGEAKGRLRALLPLESEQMLADIESVDSMISAGSSDQPIEVAPLPERVTEDEEAVEVTADRMSYEAGLLVGEGNVALQQQGASLQADHVKVNQETGEITAMGNIVMIRDGNRWEGQELLYNFKTREGSFGQSAMYFDPAYITAERTERVSTNEYVMYNARITTCSGDDPIIYAKAKEIRILDEDKASGTFVKAKHVTFYVGKVPVFYTPYWHRHLGYRVFTFTVGYGGRLGAFVMGRAQLHPADWLVSNTHFDFYSKRGLGLGQDFGWTTPNGQGGIRIYYISDSDPYDKDDSLAERALVDSERYRLQLTHREQLNEETYFQTEFNYLSDPDVLEDFFRDEFRRQANPENYAVVQHSTDEYAASLRVDRRLNDFYTTVDRIPELEFNWYRSRIKESPLYFQSDNSVSFLERLNAETTLPPAVPPSNYRSARADTYNQLFLPIHIKEFFNVIPRAAYRGTWYSDTASGASDSNLRNIFELGTLTSFKAHKMLTDKSGFYGNGLQHVIEPYADYSYRAEPNLQPFDLHQFDEVDALDEQNEVRFGLRNFIQTKRGEKRIVNFLDSDLFTTFRFDPATGEEDFGPLVGDLQMRLTDSFRIQSDFDYDWYASKFTNYNARLNYQTDDMSEYSFYYRYKEDARSLFAASASLFPNNDWSYEFLVRYDATRDEWEDRQLMVRRRFNCIGMGLGLKVDEDDEPALWFQLWLNAFGKPDDSGRLR